MKKVSTVPRNSISRPKHHGPNVLSKELFNPYPAGSASDKPLPPV